MQNSPHPPTTGKLLVCNRCCVASVFLSHKDCSRASKTNSNTDVLDSRRESRQRLEQAGDAELCLSDSCLFPGLTVNPAAIGYTPVVEETKQLKESRFTYEPFINNQSILTRVWSWKDFRTMRAARPLFCFIHYLPAITLFPP